MTNMFGQNLINWPAPAGYGITNMPVHLPTYWSLGDRHYTTNFGMATQHNIYNPGYDPKIYHLAQNAGAYAAFDPMLTSLIGNPSSFPFPGVNPSYMAPPSFGFGGADSPSNQTSAGNIHMNSVKTVYLPKLKSLVTDLETAMCEDGLSEKHQLMLQKQIDKANDLISRIETACTNKETTLEDATALQNEISTFQNQAGTIVSRINADIAKQKEAEIEEQAKKDTEMSEDAKKQIEEKTKKLSSEAADICRNIYLGCEGAGTDYDKLAVINNKLNKDNVVSVLRTWEEQKYNDNTGDKGGDNENPHSCAGLIETIFDEESWYNDNDECDGQTAGKPIKDATSSCGYVWNITCALEARAKELGLDTELSAQFTAIYDELDDTCVNQTLVQKSIKAIFDKLNEADAQNISETIAKEIQDKVDTDKKTETESKKSEVEASKKNALARALKSHFKLENDVNLSGNVQILFDDNGKFKAYKVEIEGISFEDANAMKIITDIEACGFDAKKLFYSGSVA